MPNLRAFDGLLKTRLAGRIMRLGLAGPIGVKNVAAFLPDYAETANVTICSGTPRAHGQKFRVTDRPVFAPIADNILLGAPDRGAISRRPFECGTPPGPKARHPPPVPRRQNLA